VRESGAPAEGERRQPPPDSSTDSSSTAVAASPDSDESASPSDSDESGEDGSEDGSDEAESDPEPDEGDADADAGAARPRCWVYLLESCASPHYSYMGFTVNRIRRLRQHNGELVGGAKYTKAHRPWRMVLSLSVDAKSAKDASWWNKASALILEWRCKHVRRGKGAFARRRPSRHAQNANPRWSTIRLPGRPAVERRLNDILWLLTNRDKWTKSGKAPVWDAKTMAGLAIDVHPSLRLPAVELAVKRCTFWRPLLNSAFV
jgi:predicted GIY-YIG superfamily endonuclease